MSDTTARKAIITTAQVQTALDSMVALKSEITGETLPVLSFDKGARGKGFAVYSTDDSVVHSFDSKEEAYNMFTVWVEVATEVWEAVKAKPAAAEGAKKLVKASEKVSA